jgi:hypothetical protein
VLLSVSSSSPSAFPVYGAGRHPQLYFRGLLKVHSRYGPPVCSPPEVDFCPRSFSGKISLSHCPGSYRVEPTITRAELPSASTLYPRGAPIYCMLGIIPNTLHYYRDCRKSPNLAFMINLCIVKYNSYNVQNERFRVFRQSHHKHA